MEAKRRCSCVPRIEYFSSKKFVLFLPDRRQGPRPLTGLSTKFQLHLQNPVGGF